MERGVVVTGIGVLSTLGDSAAALHMALCAGESGLHPIELFDASGLKCQQAHELSAFDPQAYLGKKNLRALDRTSRLVIAASALALEQSGWSTAMREAQDVGLVLGTMFCSVHTISEFDRRGLMRGPNLVSPMDFANTVINAAAGQAAIWHGLRGLNSTIAAGLTSGLQAIAYATDQIRLGRATALLAGGAEELCFESFLGFERAGLLCGASNGDGEFPIPFDTRRNGFTLGEGAALLMLEDAEAARARGATILADIKGHGSGYDLSRGTEAGSAVEAIARAIRLALQDANIASSAIDGFSASANGSKRMDRNEAEAILAVFGQCTPELPITAVKSMLGEALGASGAMQTVSYIEAMQSRMLPGIRDLAQVEDAFPLSLSSAHTRPLTLRNGLINSVGLDGHCCALVVAQGA